jgi:hypothetical protein
MINNSEEIKKEMSQEEITRRLVGEMLFTFFGNTEYTGYVKYEEQKGLYFITVKEGMRKNIPLDEAKELIKTGRSANFSK